jgi:hypothetical protein
MTPKEKAIELVNKFYPRATLFSLDRKNQNDNAKQCALIAVNEILNVGFVDTNDLYEYWNEVKKEIENYEQ